MERARTRRTAAAICLLTALLLAGCSYQDFRRPLIRNYAADLFYKPHRPMGEPPEVATGSEALAGALARWKQAYPAEEAPYTIGKRDLLHIVVSPGGAGAEPNVYELPVAEDGTVTLPLVGSVKVEGLSPKGVEGKLTDLYRAGYYTNAVATVYVALYQSREFYVTGAVMKPGIVTMARPRISLLEALLMAGGPSPDAGDKVVVTRAVGAAGKPAASGSAGAAEASSALAPQPAQESVQVSLKELIELSDLSRNIWIGPSDVVHVQSTGPKTILVFGYVNSPGLFALPQGERLGLLDAVGLARGLGPHARSESSYLLRRTEKGEEYYKVDLTRIASGEEPDTIVKPGDVLVVGTSWPIRAVDGLIGAGRLIPMPALP